jgi:hypothetical protein
MGIYKLRKQSENQFTLFDSGLNACDDGRIIGLGVPGKFLAYGGTNNSAVHNRVFITTNFGETWTRIADGGFPPMNANGQAFTGGKVRVWGGNDHTSTINQSWEWDEVNGWVQISAAMTGYTTSGFNRASAAHFNEGSNYYAVGGTGCNNVIVSSDLITWTEQMVLPAELQDSAGASCFKYKGEWYYLTGQKNDTAAYPGKIYKFNATFTALNQVVQNTLFETKWADIAATDDAVLLVTGHNDVGGNRKGCWYNEGDLSVMSEWRRLSYEIPATHANPLAADSGGNDVLSYCGNMRNDCWRFTRIDV